MPSQAAYSLAAVFVICSETLDGEFPWPFILCAAGINLPFAVACSKQGIEDKENKIPDEGGIQA